MPFGAGARFWGVVEGSAHVSESVSKSCIADTKGITNMSYAKQLKHANSIEPDCKEVAQA